MTLKQLRLVSVQSHHHQGAQYSCSHITTNRCILIGYFNNCNFSKHQYCAPWWWCDCTETCRSSFNVNFNVNFKILFKTVHVYISWWIKKILDNIKMHGIYVKKNILPIRSIFRDRFVWNQVQHVSAFFCCRVATQRGSWPPHSSGFLDHTQRSTTVGRPPLDEWSACRRDLYLTTHSQQTNIHVPGGIRTHDLSRRAAADLRLRPHGYWDRHVSTYWR